MRTSDVNENRSDARDSVRAEDALHEERRLLDSIIANIPSGVFWKGKDFKYRGCNEAFARSAGVARPEDIVGKTDYELAWEKEQADYFRECDRRVLEEGRAMLNIEEVERQADGRQAILRTSKVPLRDEQGQVCGVLGIDTDISDLKEAEQELRQIRAELELRVSERTAELSAANQQLRREIRERQRMEEALRLSEERYRLVSELTSDYAYAFEVGPQGLCRAEWLTDAFARISGTSPDQPGAGQWERMAHPDDLPVVQRRLRSLLAGQSVVNEFRIIAGDGRVLWLRDHARPIWDETQSRVVRILGAAQDITERKQAEEESRRHQTALAQVSRLTTLGELAGELAHELNQPLCTMMGNAQTAQRLLNSPNSDLADLRDALNDIVTSGKQAATVIKRVRGFLRQQPHPVVLNPQRMIEEIADLMEADARQHAAQVRFEVADDLPSVRGDPIQLQQVVLNLVRNGLEAVSASGGRREVLLEACCHSPDSLLIRVSDSGSGLAPGMAEQVFEPFFTTKPSGLGLGLAIARSIIEAHGGRIWAENGSGSGASFCVTLPRFVEGSLS